MPMSSPVAGGEGMVIDAGKVESAVIVYDF
jgi:hypothetical protein